MTSIIEVDQYLFHLINDTWTLPFLDTIMPYWREKSTWIPFYIIAAIWLTWKMKKRVVLVLLAAGLTIAIADTVSSQLIKKNVERLRPCRTEGLAVNLLVPCGGGYSFTSSHATNHFAIALLLIMIFAKRYPQVKWLLLWAATIAYGQVYVGVHYPFDVLTGALVGSLIGIGIAYSYRWADHYFFPSTSNEIA